MLPCKGTGAVWDDQDCRCICSVSLSVFHSCFYWFYFFKLFILTMLICSIIFSCIFDVCFVLISVDLFLINIVLTAAHVHLAPTPNDFCFAFRAAGFDNFHVLLSADGRFHNADRTFDVFIGHTKITAPAHALGNGPEDEASNVATEDTGTATATGNGTASASGSSTGLRAPRGSGSARGRRG